MEAEGIANDNLDDQPREPIHEVVIDGLAALKILKHCNDNASSVAGSLLGASSIICTFPPSYNIYRT